MTRTLWSDRPLGVKLAAVVAAGALLPLAWQKHEAQREATVAVAPAPPADVVPAPPPGAEVVPESETEIDRSPNAASPGGPTLSFARAAGLHLKPDPLGLNSSAALVVDRSSGEVLVHKNDQAVLPVASLTKLMSSLVVVEAKQPMDETITIAEADVDLLRNSRSRLRVGTSLTRQEALRLSLMSSENRAAHALGRTYPGGLEKMVEAMNAKARQLGMSQTRFVDPTGLSNANKSTARDLALLVRAAAQNPVIAEFSVTPQHLANLGGRSLQYLNSNRLVRSTQSSWDIDLQKTGYIVEAGRCLAMVADLAGREVIMVLLDAESNTARLRDAERLRRHTVAQLGGPQAVAALDARDAAVRKAAAQEKKATARKATAARKGETKTAAARKKETATPARKTATAKASGSKSKAQAAADKPAAGSKDGGRVRQTFAGTRDGGKS